jgi:putative endonuclease
MLPLPACGSVARVCRSSDMKLLSWSIYRLLELAAARGLSTGQLPPSGPDPFVARRAAGVRGETFAYWYLRRHGYTIIARNYMTPGVKGEIDLIGYDRGVLAFIEVKTRTGSSAQARPEDAVNADKRHYLSRMARQFLTERRILEARCRFDVVAIEAKPGRRPEVRLHKGAFAYH